MTYVSSQHIHKEGKISQVTYLMFKSSVLKECYITEVSYVIIISECDWTS